MRIGYDCKHCGLGLRFKTEYNSFVEYYLPNPKCEGAPIGAELPGWWGSVPEGTLLVLSGEGL